MNSNISTQRASWLGKLLLLLLVSACETRTIRHAGFEDLVVGSYTVKLYTNGECEVEMGLGYHDGEYTLRGDTIRITYQQGRLVGMPNQLLLTPGFLVTLPTPEYPHSTRIRLQ